MQLPSVPLEDWMRGYYFDNRYDLGSSGLKNFSLADIRARLGITAQELDEVVFDDSYTTGSLGLRRAIAARWGNGDPEWVLAANGSNEAGFLIMTNLLRPGDEVVVLDPIYHTLCNIAATIGCKVVPWPLRPERGFRPDLDELQSLLTPKTRMVAVNFPHNPTGMSLTSSEYDQLIDIVSATGAYLAWDAAFEEMVYTGDPLPNPVSTYDRAISMGTLSKGYGLAGLRVGWCIAAPELLAGCMRIRDYTSLYLSPLVEMIAQRAVEKADLLLGAQFPWACRNLDILADWVEAHPSRVQWHRPMGGVTALVRLLGMDDTETFCKSLSSEKGVMLVPGNCFKFPGHVRLGFGTPTDYFRKGLARLTEFLMAWPKT